MLQANHYDMDMIRDCAEKVASHWQQLMLKMEDRLKLVNASVAFYKTSEQVRRQVLCPGLLTSLLCRAAFYRTALSLTPQSLLSLSVQLQAGKSILEVEEFLLISGIKE